MIAPSREAWTADETGDFGRGIYESIPSAKRPRWAADLLDLCAATHTAIPELEALVIIAQDPARWREAHDAFQKVRALTLKNERSWNKNKRLQLLLDIGETTGKVIYNASGAPAPFDYHAGWRMAPRVKALVAEVRDSDLEERAWKRLIVDAHAHAS